MSGEKRRENLLKILQESTNPVSGTELAEKFNVSRQIVVQDIALLRAKNHEIISTHKGYILNDEETFKRVFKVKHTTEQIPDELNCRFRRSDRRRICVSQSIRSHKS